MQLKNLQNKKNIFILIILLSAIFPIHFSSAEDIEQLENQIDEYSKKIEELDKEIEEKQAKLVETNKKATTLQSTVNNLTATEKKIETNIEKTQTNIQKSETTLKKLAIEIDDKAQRIEKNTESLALAIRSLNDVESTSLIEVVLTYDDFSIFWNLLNSIDKFQEKIKNTILTLRGLNQELRERHELTAEEKEQLKNFEKELAGEREVVQYTKKEKSTLLSQTRNEEAEYQKILAQKKAEREAFEKELFNIESKLKAIIDPNSFPDARNGILGWPVSGFVFTQGYGNTQFAQSNPQFYSTGFHNGVDLAVPMGTAVVAAADGIVKGTGNTDNFPGCRSWGGWVLIEHPNGLSTMHAHLSSAIVQEGQQVTKGQTIAYSGSTGISTGPHLHFTVYKSQGVKVDYYKNVAPSSRGCGATNARIPFAQGFEAYINPLEYLPKL